MWLYGERKKKQEKKEKKLKTVKGNLYFTDNRLSRSEMWCVVDNHNYLCHILCEKDF